MLITLVASGTMLMAIALPFLHRAAAQRRQQELSDLMKTINKLQSELVLMHGNPKVPKHAGESQGDLESVAQPSEIVESESLTAEVRKQNEMAAWIDMLEIKQARIADRAVVILSNDLLRLARRPLLNPQKTYRIVLGSSTKSGTAPTGAFWPGESWGNFPGEYDDAQHVLAQWQPSYADHAKPN